MRARRRFTVSNDPKTKCAHGQIGGRRSGNSPGVPRNYNNAQPMSASPQCDDNEALLLEIQRMSEPLAPSNDLWELKRQVKALDAKRTRLLYWLQQDLTDYTRSKEFLRRRDMSAVEYSAWRKELLTEIKQRCERRVGRDVLRLSRDLLRFRGYLNNHPELGRSNPGAA